MLTPENNRLTLENCFRGRVTNRIVRIVAFCGLLIPFEFSIADPEPAVATIVAQTNRIAYYLGRDGRARASMVITDSRGRERKRHFTILRWDDQSDKDPNDAISADQKYYVFLHHPADVRNTVLLVWKHPDGEDDRWLYLPALDLVKRIAAGDKRTSFLGSHFFYEDISGRDVTVDHHELVDVTENYYVLRNTPKLPNTVEFSYFTMWVHRDTYIPVLVEFYDKQGEKYRVYEALRVETVEGYPTVVNSRMKDLRTHAQTDLRFSRVDYNVGLPEDIFTERHLRNAPRRFFR